MTEAGHEVTGHFYNPNIHPLIEFRRRKKAQKILQERLPIEMIYEEDYGLREYLEAVRWQGQERCADCYRLRLGRTARKAAELGFDALSTTLLGSVQQDHELIRAVAEECARGAGVRLYYEDWRGLHESGHEQAAAWRLYLQQYCGCVFSEFERYRDTTRHVYRGSGPAAKA